MNGFTDKELQICAQLAYFNFAYESKESINAMIDISLIILFHWN